MAVLMPIGGRVYNRVGFSPVFVARSTTRYGANLATHLPTTTVNREAQVLAFNHVFQVVAGCFLAAWPLGFLLRRGGGGAPAEVAAE